MFTQWKRRYSWLVLLTSCASLEASTFTVTANGHTEQSSAPLGVVDQLSGAFAGFGRDSIRAFAGAVGQGAAGTGSGSAGATARSEIDDLIFTGPLPTFQTHLRIPFDGSFGFDTQQLFNFNNHVLAESNTSQAIFLNASMDCGCGLPFLMNGRLEIDADSSTNNPTVRNNTQDTETIHFDTLIQLPITGVENGEPGFGFDTQRNWGVEGFFDGGLVTVPTGVPIHLLITLSTSTNTVASGALVGNGSVDFFHTFGLPTGVPVFDLPDGFTVNAPSIGLVNNIIPNPDSPVPEPTTAAMLGLAVFGAGLHFRRRVARRRL